MVSEKSPFDIPFDELPNPRQVWIGAPGSREEGLGRLSLLTTEVVSRAAAEIKEGRRVTLGWDMTKLEVANLNRQPCQHHIISLLPGRAFDDIYIMNPRTGPNRASDILEVTGLTYLKSRAASGTVSVIFHNMFPPQKINLPSRCSTVVPPLARYWIGQMTVSGYNIGLVKELQAADNTLGRGVLIDYAAYAAKRGITYTTFSQHHICLTDILEIAKESNLTFHRGDILFVRIGVINEWDNIMTDAEKLAYSLAPNPEHAGVEATVDVLRWLWDCGFSAVAGDAISWEVYPPKQPDVFLHEYLLAGWGMPIGELFDLEELARTCQDLKRWSFFVTSVPLNMPGGVSSPPNALAIF